MSNPTGDGMDERTWTCRGCDKTGTEPVRAGRRRRWCSDRCRKQASYGGTCERCGGTTDSSGGKGKNAPTVCAHCCGPEIADRMAAAHGAQRDKLAALYRAGVPFLEIAQRMGYTGANPQQHVGAQLYRLRRYGYDLPYRYTMVDGKRVAA